MTLLTNEQISQLSLLDVHQYISLYSNELQKRAENLAKAMNAQTEQAQKVYREGIGFINKSLKSQLGADPNAFNYINLTSLKSARSKLRHLRDALAAEKTTIPGVKSIIKTRAQNANNFLKSRGVNVSALTEAELSALWRTIRHFIDSGWSSDEAITKVSQAPPQVIDTEDYNEIEAWLEENTI